VSERVRRDVRRDVRRYLQHETGGRDTVGDTVGDTVSEKVRRDVRRYLQGHQRVVQRHQRRRARGVVRHCLSGEAEEVRQAAGGHAQPQPQHSVRVGLRARGPDQLRVVHVAHAHHDYEVVRGCDPLRTHTATASSTRHAVALTRQHADGPTRPGSSCVTEGTRPRANWPQATHSIAH
jgi:hypothetical protein